MKRVSAHHAVSCIASLLLFAAAATLAPAAPGASSALEGLKAGWEKPARTFKPHTRWWWPGNALTKADITWQLEQMAAQGIGGVEIMSAWKMYDKGNIEYLTPEFLELVKHAVAEAKRLDIEVAITFSPGWSFGGPWVAREDQSKALCMGSVEVQGGAAFSGALPSPGAQAKAAQTQTGRPAAAKAGKKAGQPKGARKAAKKKAAPAMAQAETHPSSDPGTLVAVVAARLTGEGQLDPASLTVLTDRVKPGTSQLAWDAPAGRWILMAFWLKYTGQECQAQNAIPPAMVIDHLSQGAMQRYCDYLGGALAKAVGGEFGKTIDSFFCDSFEIHPLPDSLLWSNDTLAGFEKFAGYDLTPYLPALWLDAGPLTPRVRYDLGAYLNELGLKTVFKTFGDWCAEHHVQARLQPHYRFTEELVQGAGATARPETEVTTARFEPVADPRKATASGARFYGRDIVSAESYTFIHPARYRTDLQDLKIATDAFLRDGVTQFYNHGYFASPELHVAPSRDMPWANRISHWNTWWPYYHCVAQYVARCCAVLRQGRLAADVLIYSPQATAWSERAIWVSDRRVMPYGNLAKTLVANGYDFDIVNDDLLQRQAKAKDGRIEINGHAYRVLLLPRATVIPIETMRAIRDFAQAGGAVIALDELPAAAAGMRNHEANDRELREIVARLFDSKAEGKAGGVFLPDYKVERTPFSPARQPWTPTPPLNDAQRRLLGALGAVVAPDFALAGHAQSDGLTFIHKRVEDVDLYFVTNLQPNPIKTEAGFRVSGKTPQRWDAVTGKIAPVADFRWNNEGTTIPLAFAPWESAFFVFTPGADPAKNGPFPYNMTRVDGGEVRRPIDGEWKMKLEGYGFETYETKLAQLASWTDNPRTQHFSGTGRYEIEFDLPRGEGAVQGARMILDLGQVGTVAEVELNGQPVGVAWMAPYKLDITAAARPGRNKLVVLVTNTLINYVTGLKEPPDVPAALQPRLGKANPAIYPQSQLAYREMSETDLPPSGLIGPVKIVWENAGQ